MSEIALRVEFLSKKYPVRRLQEPYGTLRDYISDAFLARFRGRRGNHEHSQKVKQSFIWALKDVSFEVKRGEVVGLIGRNGAGKSTLLKILSRITEPTTGLADIHGRVGCILEVGTGFHAELSGRENIFLNGAILGMSRSEISTKFDEIVAFAEVDQFIDTPIKHYSTGMHLRLAFAVAAYLNPEILLIDEVLAVGDANFQKKCLGQMDKVARGGRTVLFVSHNMAAVRALCTRAAVLDRGQLCFLGEAERAIHFYNTSLRSKEWDLPWGEVSFTDVYIHSSGRGPVLPSEPFEVRCRLHLKSRLSGFHLVCVIEDAAAAQIAVVFADHHRLKGVGETGVHDIAVRFPAMWLRTGVYNVYFKINANALGLAKGRFVSDIAMLDVVGDSHAGIMRSLLTPAVEWIWHTRQPCSPATRDDASAHVDEEELIKQQQATGTHGQVDSWRGTRD